jgi:DNA mismatch repair protein MutS2
MDEKTLQTLEYPKILQRLSKFCSFAVSAEKALALRPSGDIEKAFRWQAETREARQLLDTRSDLGVGATKDIRPAVDLSLHGGVLSIPDLLDIRSTLIAARTLARAFERLAAKYPHLFEISEKILPAPGLIEAIGRTISEHGEMLDSASVKLASIRRELNITHQRLLGKLERMLADPKINQYLQESLITHRDGRFVLPLRADFKGKIKSIVHDQSSSGATIFVEPLNVVELNNRNRELQLEQRDEERRILSELSNQVAGFADQLSQSLEALSSLDLIFAKAKYAEEIAATEPSLHPFPTKKARAAQKEGHHPGSIMRIYQARHPLLDSASVVPIDVELDSQTYALVITGPNTGGKTVTLKTVGLLALMAQSGLQIPAHSGTEISLFDLIFADIGDEQSIEQSLSTFSGHITNIIRILDHADEHSLVILDELGAGTDPQEGAALARSLLTHLLDRGITTLVSTHHPELKAFAHATAGLANASVEFDLETLQPTFHLTVGLPGRSNALAIAQRLGMPQAIISSARAELNPQDLRADDLLEEIHHQRDLSRQARANAEEIRKEAELLKNDLKTRLDHIEEERKQMLEEAHAEVSDQVEEFKSELEGLRKELARARQPLQPAKEIKTQIDAVEDKLDESFEISQAFYDLNHKTRPLEIGDQVRIKSLNAKGLITSLDEDEAEVHVGNLRIRSRIDDLELDLAASLPQEQERPAEVYKIPYDRASPGWEMDLRGQRADEAIDNLNQYLDAAYLAGLPFVRIIHGKGTGKLRDTIRQLVGHHTHVASFEPGGEKEGGEGVTIIKLNID